MPDAVGIIRAGNTLPPTYYQRPVLRRIALLDYLWGQARKAVGPLYVIILVPAPALYEYRRAFPGMPIEPEDPRGPWRDRLDLLDESGASALLEIPGPSPLFNRALASQSLAEFAHARAPALFTTFPRLYYPKGFDLAVYSRALIEEEIGGKAEGREPKLGGSITATWRCKDCGPITAGFFHTRSCWTQRASYSLTSINFEELRGHVEHLQHQQDLWKIGPSLKYLRKQWFASQGKGCRQPGREAEAAGASAFSLQFYPLRRSASAPTPTQEESHA